MLKTNSICYDWFTFTDKIDSITGIIDMLGMSDCTFVHAFGRYLYADCMRFGGVSIYYNGRNEDVDMGICVEMSGQGCRDFEAYGHGDYKKIFRIILDNYNVDASKRDMNITRLDIAFDDFEGVLDLRLLCKECQLGNFVSILPDWHCDVGNKELAVCHGSRNSSNVYIRFYDKFLEQLKKHRLKADVLSADLGGDHWIRAELMLKKECALGFIQSDLSVEETYFQVLNYYLRYVIRTDNVSNKRMLDTAPYWLKFIKSADRRSIFCKPATKYDPSKLFSYVRDQCSAAIDTYIKLVGEEKFLEDIKNSRSGKVLNPKYERILADATAHEHGAALLAAIGEEEQS